MPKLKKGDAVAELRSWDDKGTFTIRRATVHSCGSKVLRLTDIATGEMFKVAYSPESALIVADADDATLKALALERAAAFLIEERERAARKLENPAYHHPSVRKGLAELHEPIAVWHSDAVAEVRARIEAERQK